MHRTAKIIAIIFVIALILSLAIVPTFALAYPDPLGTVGVEYWQPLTHVVLYSDETGESDVWGLDRYWSVGENIDAYVTLASSNGYSYTMHETTTGTSTKKIQLEPGDGYEDIYVETDIGLKYVDFTADVDLSTLSQFQPINDIYIITEGTTSSVSCTISFVINYYSLTSEGVYSLTTKLIESNCDLPASSSSYGYVIPVQYAINDAMRDAITYYVPTIDSIATVPIGFTDIDFTIDSMADGADSESSFRGIVTTARAKSVNGNHHYYVGELFVKEIYAPNTTSGGSYEDGFQDGADAGYNDGFQDGYLDGEQQGYDKGYNQGLEDGSELADSEYDAAWESGYNAGVQYGSSDAYDVGYEDGKEVGYTNGYNVGYDTGYLDGYEGGGGGTGDFNLGTFLVNSLTTFLDAPIFGDVTLGAILLILITIPLVLLFLKMFARG